MKIDIGKKLKSIRLKACDEINTLLIEVCRSFFIDHSEVNTIGIGAAYEYNDEDYSYRYRINADQIDINGYNMWTIEGESDVVVYERSKIKTADEFQRLANLLAYLLEDFDGELHSFYGDNFRLIISRESVNVELN